MHAINAAHHSDSGVLKLLVDLVLVGTFLC